MNKFEPAQIFMLKSGPERHLRFLDGGGAMGRQIARYDWAATSLGPIITWPSYMRHTVAMLLRAAVPMAAMWREDGIIIYNDALAALAGGRHPQMLGAKFRDACPAEIGLADEVLKAVLAGGTLAYRDLELTRHRAGKDGTIWLNLDFSPVVDDYGTPVGVLALVMDNTDSHARGLLEAQRDNERNRMWSLSQEYMLIFDYNGVISASNPAITTISGWTEDDLAGHSLVEFLHPDDVEPTIAQVMRAAQGESVFSFENRCRMKDGSYRRIDWAAVPETGLIHTLGRDITEERKALRERERSWRLSPVIEAIFNEAGQLSAVNPAWTRLLGWSEAESIGREMAGFLAAEDQPACLANLAALRAGQPVAETIASCITKSGELRQISWTVAAEDGLIYGFGHDLTAEQEALAALVASTAERERIWASTNDLIGIAGSDSFLKSANPAWSRLLGYSNEELFSQSFLNFIDEGDHPKVENAIARLAEGKPLRDFEIRLAHVDGKRSLISWVAEPFGDHFYIVGRDVTEQRMAEEALRQSQKMEAVGQLTGGLAHDFNNMLQGMTSSLEILQINVAQGRLDHLDRFIAGAMGAANRAAALTHRLLAFSRRQPLNPRPVRVNTLVAAMEELLHRTTGEHIALELVLGGGLWLTMCDPNQLENAVLNLAINARDAMQDGGRLTIESSNVTFSEADPARIRELSPGHYVCIAVTDTGTGMSQEIMGKAFEPFFTTKPIGHGTGLGLSMIYGFARQSNGYAKIDSAPGKGTTVKLFLPRFKGHNEPGEPVVARQMAPPKAAGETVLVIEDEALVRSLIVEMLSNQGYVTIEAKDGAAGLGILQSKRRIDLLITDIGLPGLNGTQVADAGRQLRPELKVLFMTGYAESASSAAGFMAPGMAIITKPFGMEKLAMQIRGLIDDKTPLGG